MSVEKLIGNIHNKIWPLYNCVSTDYSEILKEMYKDGIRSVCIDDLSKYYKIVTHPSIVLLTQAALLENGASEGVVLEGVHLYSEGTYYEQL